MLQDTTCLFVPQPMLGASQRCTWRYPSQHMFVPRVHRHSVPGSGLTQQTTPWSHVWPPDPSVQSHPFAEVVQVVVMHAHVDPALGQVESAQQTEPGTAVVSHSVLFADPGWLGSGAPQVQAAVPVLVQLVEYLAVLASGPTAPSPPPPAESAPTAASPPAWESAPTPASPPMSASATTWASLASTCCCGAPESPASPASENPCLVSPSNKLQLAEVTRNNDPRTPAEPFRDAMSRFELLHDRCSRKARTGSCK
jgi:hypothetical protein